MRQKVRRPAAATINVYDRVALTEDLPEHQLVRGEVGTVTEILSGDVFEVLFQEHEEHKQVIVTLHANKLTVIGDRLSNSTLH